MKKNLENALRELLKRPGNMEDRLRSLIKEPRKNSSVNGIELPEGFTVSSVINNLILSNDGRYAAVTKTGDIIIADIPDDGKITIDEKVVQYKKGTGARGISILGNGSVSGCSINISTGGYNISVGEDLNHEINESYENVSKVSLNSTSRDIEAGLSNDNKTYLKGFISKEPDYREGILTIRGLKGNIILPKSVIWLEQYMDVTSGDISGDIAHKGRISSTSGSISINLCSPLRVKAEVTSGDIHIYGMIAEGSDFYVPPSINSIGDLYLKATSGNINVRYKA